MNVRIFLADPNIRHEQVEMLQGQLFDDWSLARDPTGATAILTQDADIGPEILSAAGGALLLIGRLGPGTAAVAPTAVPVIDLPNAALISVAEHAIMLMLALSRHLFWVAHQTAAQQWTRGVGEPILTDQRQYVYNWVGLEDFATLYGKVVGIIGLGTVGRAVAQRLKMFGVRLIYTQRQRLNPEVERDLGVRWREFDDLLRESDFVTLHHRYQDGPDGNDMQFGSRQFNLMKPTAYFINTSRGRMVDEAALATALEQGRLAGAGLDVFRFEPLPANNPLLQLAGDNLILTAHVAGVPVTEAWQVATQDFLDRLAEELVAATSSAEKGER